MIDIHSHILPGLDDGPKDEALLLEMLRIAEKDGIQEIVATPHIIPGVFSNNYENIKEAVDKVNNLIINESLDINVHIGAEHYLDDGFRKILRDDNLCTINNKGKYVLVEFPMQEIPSYGDELFFEIQLKGVTPILAHPERNAGIIKNPAHIYELISRGILMQINASSILGHFGHDVADMTEIMLRHNWVHFIASDAHSAGVRSPRLSEAVQIAKKFIGDKVDDLVYNNPQKILVGESIELGEINTYQFKNSFFKKIRYFLH